MSEHPGWGWRLEQLYIAKKCVKKLKIIKRNRFNSPIKLTFVVQIGNSGYIEWVHIWFDPRTLHRQKIHDSMIVTNIFPGAVDLHQTHRRSTQHALHRAILKSKHKLQRHTTRQETSFCAVLLEWRHNSYWKYAFEEWIHFCIEAC